MKTNLKRIFAAFLTVLVVMGMVGPASAATVEELEALIAQLQQQIQVLLGQQQSQPALLLTKDLRYGMTDPEVSILQQGLARDPQVYPEGLVTGYFGTLTRAAVVRFQEKYASEVLTPLGLTSGTGFVGAATRAKFNALYGTPVVPSVTPTPSVSPSVSPTPSVTPAEGSISINLYGTPASGTQVRASQTDVAIMAFETRAYSSDMTLQRVNVDFDFRPWLYLRDVSLWDGSTLVGRINVSSSNVEEIEVGRDYRVVFSGINVSVPKDATKVLTVKVSTLGSPLTGTWVTGKRVELKAQAVRAIDTAGLNQYAPADSNVVYRIFDFKDNDVVEIDVLANANSPVERVVRVSKNSPTYGVSALVFDLMAKAGDARLQKITVEVSDNVSSVALNKLVNNVYLYYGGNVIASAAISDGAVGATTVDLALTPSSYVTLPADQRATFELKVDIPANPIEGNKLVLKVNKIYAENSATYATIDPTVNFAGKAIYAYINYPTLALVGSNPVPTLDPNSSSLAGATIQMAVTANGHDIYVHSTSGVVATSTAATTTLVISGPGVETYATTSGTYFVIRNGETKTLSLAISMDNDSTKGGTPGQKQAWISKFIWDDKVGADSIWTDMLGLGSDTTPGSIFYTLPVNMGD